MPLPPNTANYKVGGMIVRLGGLDLGNIVSGTADPTQIEVLQHFTSRSGTRKVDRQIVTQKRLIFRFTLDEHNADLYRKFFMAGNTGLLVDALTLPLVETNASIIYLEETGNIWTYSHTKVTARPAGPMDMGEFTDWTTYELEVEALEDAAATPPQGRFTFTA